jgi:hypothetical protein
MLGMGGGKPLGPTGCFLSAGVLFIAAVYLLVVALRSKKDELRWGRSGDGAPASLVSVLLWILYPLLWAICFLAQGGDMNPSKYEVAGCSEVASC